LQGSHIQFANSKQAQENPAHFKKHACVLPNMFFNALPALTVDCSQTGDIFHYAL